MTARELADGLAIDILTVYSYARSSKPKVPAGFPAAHRFGRTLYYLREDYETYLQIDHVARRVARARARKRADTPA